ncbi:MAG: FG-GAP repeat protein [Alphaproteobacteria bacterium]|nr:FG-GAP repeat protein [Alphaproteobacteria bacterium]MCB9792023.1 FG-GAP repeat protein [Alphaproteobacteria bacterium]
MERRTRLLLLALLAACGGKDAAEDSGDSPQGEDTGPFDADGDGFSAAEDCDDADRLRFPGAEERCDAVDQDCDGAVDEGVLRTAWVDADGDGYGDPEAPVEVCRVGEGLSLDDRDCDDTDPGISPLGVEACDFIDQDCDGLVDEGAPDATTWYADADGDGHGDPEAGVQGCEQGPSGTVAQASDCDDGDASVYPGAPELCDDGVVNDCEAAPEEAWAQCGLVGEDTLSVRVADLLGPGDDRFGFAVADAGDVNGDGYHDVLVGAELVTHQYILDGSVFLFHGPFSGSYTHGDAAAEIQGEAYEAYLGISVHGPGDLDGDGYDDLVMGSLHNRLLLTEEPDLGGGLHVALGPVTGTVPQTGTDLELRLNEDHNHMALRIASGDIDQDGHTDLVTGTWYFGEADIESESVVVWFGPHEAATEARTPELSLVTVRETTQITGMALADLDGDGGDDMALGPLPGGGVAVFHGPLQGGRQALDSYDVLLSSGDLSAGANLVTLPDADGDGYVDLAVSASASSASASGGGAVFLVMDPRSSGALDSLATGVLFGDPAPQGIGHQMGAGDHDGDGLSDLYLQTVGVGARVSAVPGDLAGRWEVMDAELWSVVGESGYGAVAGGLAVGELDGDRWPELILGSGTADGRVSIIDGVGY